jgi:hypothetical protein
MDPPSPSAPAAVGTGCAVDEGVLGMLGVLTTLDLGELFA